MAKYIIIKNNKGAIVLENKEKTKKASTLKTKLLIYTFIAVFLSVSISNIIFQLIGLDSSLSPQMAILVSAIVNMLIAGIVLYIIFDKIIGTSLRRLLLNIENIAQGDYTAIEEIKEIKKLPNINNALNQVVKNGKDMAIGIKSNSNILSKNSEDLASILEDTTVSVENIAQSVNEIANGSEDTSKNINELSEAISNLNQLSQDTDNYAEQATELSVFMASSAQEGNIALDNIMGMISSIESNTKDTSKIIADLNNQIKNIDNIVLIINEIAEQTNLLALNAAIEAARAGDAGRGFAVVAEEISKLADATHSYSQEISSITQNVSNSSTKAVNSVDEVINVVQKSVDTATSTKASFDSLLLAIDQINSAIIEITETAKEVRNNSGYILERATEISAISEETTAASETSAAAVESNLASMEEITASIQNLSSIANELNSIVGHIKI
mgnify:CR=1 FL=1